MNFQLGKYYSFTTVAAVLLGLRFTAVKLTSIMEYDDALTLKPLQELWRQVFPLLPEGTVDDPRLATWLKFQDSQGNVTILADAWLVPGSVELGGGMTVTYQITNLSQADHATIMNCLTLMGYRSVAVSIVSSETP